LIDIYLREYARLLGYPAGKPLEGDVLARAEDAIDWYRRHGRPSVYTRTVGSETAAAITAGFEVEEEVAQLWAKERVDEAYFLDRLAAAVVEHLALSLGTPRSPGHRGFPIEEQSRLYALLEPTEIKLLPSGMLNPRNSLLALYGPEAGGASSINAVGPHPHGSRRSLLASLFARLALALGLAALALRSGSGLSATRSARAALGLTTPCSLCDWRCSFRRKAA
jgi:hypothetical protein